MLRGTTPSNLLTDWMTSTGRPGTKSAGVLDRENLRLMQQLPSEDGPVGRRAPQIKIIRQYCER